MCLPFEFVDDFSFKIANNKKFYIKNSKMFLSVILKFLELSLLIENIFFLKTLNKKRVKKSLKL